jgi:alpha-tubulin suppressor-like RCC1 family protein
VAKAVAASGAPVVPSTVLWSSSNSSIVEVSEGTLGRARIAGIAQGGPVEVTATFGGKSAAVQVTVVPGAAPPGDLVFSSVSAGAYHTCALTVDGIAYCWGENRTGALGDGTLIGRLVPTPVAGGHRFTSISAGEGTCGITVTGHALCWGSADAYRNVHSEPCGWVACLPGPLAGVEALTFASIEVGQGHTCAVTTSGAGYCWGYAEYAALGADTSVYGCATAYCDKPTPVAGGLTWAAINPGSYSATCGVTRSGAAYCWGFNWGGALGTRSLPWQIALSPGPGLCVDIDVGWYVPCAFTPLQVDGGLTYASVDVGIATSCGLTTSGSAYCWGEDVNGHLGSPNVPPGTVGPVEVFGGLMFRSLSVGVAGFACGVTMNSAAVCWGDNGTGGLGSSATDEYSAVPRAVASDLAFAMVSAGGNWGPLYRRVGHACGVTTGGSVYCWGDNREGQLGNGNTQTRYVPSRAIGPLREK